MKKLLLIAVLLFSGMANALVVAPPQSPVTNIYEVDFVRGNNANPCTTTRPCKTVSGTAAKVTKANSIIYVRGVGTEETAQSVLAIGVSIKCENPTTHIKAMSALNPMIAGYSANQGTLGNQSISNCTLDGNNRLGISAVEFKGREFVGYDNVTIKDWDDHGVNINGMSTTELEPGIVGQVASKLARGTYFTNSTCNNSTKFSGYGRGCLQIGSVDGMLISNSSFNEDTRAGVGGSNGWNIKFLNGGGIKDLKVLNNSFSRESKDGDQFNFNIELTSLMGTSEVAYNSFTGAIDINGTFSNTRGVALDYHDNDVSGNLTTGLCTTAGCQAIAVDIEYNSSDIWVRNSRFKNIQSVVNLEFHNDTGTIHMDNIHFENNLAYNVCNTLAQAGTSSTVLARYSNLYWQGNTIYGAGAGLCGGTGWAMSINNGADFIGLVFRNNIVMNFSTAPIMFFGSTTKLLDSVSLDSNVFFNNGNSNNPFFNGVPQPSNYVEVNTIKSNPLFKNASGLLNTTLDFKITGASPAKNTGADIVMPIDMLNTPRQSKTSIGAIEYRTGD